MTITEADTTSSMLEEKTEILTTGTLEISNGIKLTEAETTSVESVSSTDLMLIETKTQAEANGTSLITKSEFETTTSILEESIDSSTLEDTVEITDLDTTWASTIETDKTISDDLTVLEESTSTSTSTDYFSISDDTTLLEQETTSLSSPIISNENNGTESDTTIVFDTLTSLNTSTSLSTTGLSFFLINYFLESQKKNFFTKYTLKSEQTNLQQIMFS